MVELVQNSEPDNLRGAWHPTMKGNCMSKYSTVVVFKNLGKAQAFVAALRARVAFWSNDRQGLVEIPVSVDTLAGFTWPTFPIGSDGRELRYFGIDAVSVKCRYRKAGGLTHVSVRVPKGRPMEWSGNGSMSVHGREVPAMAAYRVRDCSPKVRNALRAEWAEWVEEVIE